MKGGCTATPHGQQRKGWEHVAVAYLVRFELKQVIERQWVSSLGVLAGILCVDRRMKNRGLRLYSCIGRQLALRLAPE